MPATRTKSLSLARLIAPEDLAPGVYINVLHDVEESHPLFASCEPSAPPPRVSTYASIPQWPLGPLRVVAVCLPFVLVEFDCGQKRQLDVRRAALVRVPEEYAKAAFGKRARDESESGKKKRKRRKK